MKVAVARKWVKALEGGGYKQWRCGLHDKSGVGRASYCCLGVLARIQGCKFVNGHPQLAGKEVGDAYVLNPSFCGITHVQQDVFVRMNDSQNLSFKQIAQYIRKNILKQKGKKLVKK